MSSIVPHSWGVTAWPEAVWPHRVGKARYVVRVHRDELLQQGALARVGRELVVIGARYERWLQKQASNVPAYETNVAKAQRARS
jgi:hypothetical protein